MVSNCKDYESFCKAGLSDIYQTIGGYNLFMVCEKPDKSAFRPLPSGYSIRLCREYEIEAWQHVVVEEQHVSYVGEYYDKVYAKKKDEFFRRCTFICDANDTPVASSFIWKSYDMVNTVGWFRVLPEHEGKGLGRALLTCLLSTAEYPVYLHTQPTSICAIKLYSDFGFKLITNPVIGYRQNHLAESQIYLQKVMPKSDYERLQFVEVNDDLHKAALSSKQGEF